MILSFDDSRLVGLLRSGAVAVLPTDTVYGLVARAEDEAAIAKLYQTKPREQQPGTLIAASVDDLKRLKFFPKELTYANKYWPASISVVLNAANVPFYLKHTRDSLAVRIPDNRALRALLEQTGPLMTTSANPPKKPTAETIQAAINYFSDAVEVYVDGGNMNDRPASTIISLSPTGAPTVLRQGAVNIE